MVKKEENGLTLKLIHKKQHKINDKKILES